MKVMHTSFKNNIYCSSDYTGQQKKKNSKVFHIAEPEHNSQIALSPINVKGQVIKLINYVCNKKVKCWFLIAIYSSK
jgi:hypothetical protein